jgi:hypothetical protein
MASLDMIPLATAEPPVLNYGREEPSGAARWIDETIRDVQSLSRYWFWYFGGPWWWLLSLVLGLIVGIGLALACGGLRQFPVLMGVGTFVMTLRSQPNKRVW